MDTFLSLNKIFEITLSNGRLYSEQMRADSAQSIAKTYKKLAPKSEFSAEIEEFESTFPFAAVPITNRTGGQDCRDFLFDLWQSRNGAVRSVLTQAIETSENIKQPIDLIKSQSLTDPNYHREGSVIDVSQFSMITTKEKNKTVTSESSAILQRHATVRSQPTEPMEGELNSTVFLEKMAELENKFKNNMKSYAKVSDLENYANLNYVDTKFDILESKITEVLNSANNFTRTESGRLSEILKTQIIDELKSTQDFTDLETIKSEVKTHVLDSFKNGEQSKSEFTPEEIYGFAQCDQADFVRYKNSVIQAKGKGVVQMVLTDQQLWETDPEDNNEFMIDIQEIMHRLNVKKFDRVPGKRIRISKRNNLIIFAKVTGNSSAFHATTNFITDLIARRFDLNGISLTLLMPEEYNIDPILNRWKTDLKILVKYIIKPSGMYMLILNDGADPDLPEYDYRCTTLNVRNPRELVKMRNPTIPALQSIALGTHFAYQGRVFETPAEFSKKDQNNRMHYQEYKKVVHDESYVRRQNEQKRNRNHFRSFQYQAQIPQQQQQQKQQIQQPKQQQAQQVPQQQNLQHHQQHARQQHHQYNTQQLRHQSYQHKSAQHQNPQPQTNQHNPNQQLNNCGQNPTEWNYNEIQVQKTTQNANNNSESVPPVQSEFTRGGGHADAMNRNARYRENLAPENRDPNVPYGLERYMQNKYVEDRNWAKSVENVGNGDNRSAEFKHYDDVIAQTNNLGQRNSQISAVNTSVTSNTRMTRF